LTFAGEGSGIAGDARALSVNRLIVTTANNENLKNKRKRSNEETTETWDKKYKR
jgi:hypothetical protein